MNATLIGVFLLLRIAGFLAFIHFGKIKEALFDIVLSKPNLVETQQKVLPKNQIDN